MNSRNIPSHQSYHLSRLVSNRYQSQLEMLNPQRTLERGYAVIMTEKEQELKAIRNPNELKASASYSVYLAEGKAEIILLKASSSLEP